MLSVREIGHVSDSLQMPLSTTNGEIKGNASLMVKLGRNLGLSFDLKAIGLFKSEQFGVLAHVSGDLYVISCYYDKTSALSMFVLDNRKMANELSTLIKPSDNLREVIARIRPAVMAAFQYRNKEWHPIKLPN